MCGFLTPIFVRKIQVNDKELAEKCEGINVILGFLPVRTWAVVVWDDWTTMMELGRPDAKGLSMLS